MPNSVGYGFIQLQGELNPYLARLAIKVAPQPESSLADFPPPRLRLIESTSSNILAVLENQHAVHVA